MLASVDLTTHGVLPPCCGGRMVVVETFDAGCLPPYAQVLRIDTS
jgi:hypothetical protein